MTASKFTTYFSSLPRVSGLNFHSMKALTLFAFIFLSGCGGNLQSVHASSTLQQQVAAGGTITLPAGTVNIDCASQLAISKSTTLIGAGRDLTILHDTCGSGNTITIDVSSPANVRIEELTVVHDGGASVIRLSGGSHGFTAVLKRVLRLSNVELSGATNCLVSDGLNLLFIEKSYIMHCLNDGAQIASFGVTLHDNWFGENGRNGVSFVDGTAVDLDTGEHFSGFCASCSGNEFWHNKTHGLVYNVTAIADARHVGDYVDSNGDVGMVVHGVRDFSFTSGWIGSNQNGGAIVDDTPLGTVIAGNTWTANFGPNLVVAETSGPLRVSGNVSSQPHDPCDAKINGSCASLNQ